MKPSAWCSIVLLLGAGMGVTVAQSAAFDVLAPFSPARRSAIEAGRPVVELTSESDVDVADLLDYAALDASTRGVAVEVGLIRGARKFCGRNGVAASRTFHRRTQRLCGGQWFQPGRTRLRIFVLAAWQRPNVRTRGEGEPMGSPAPPDEVEGPIFETLDLYKVKSGEGIVSELFSFRALRRLLDDAGELAVEVQQPSAPSAPIARASKPGMQGGHG